MANQNFFDLDVQVTQPSAAASPNTITGFYYCTDASCAQACGTESWNFCPVP